MRRSWEPIPEPDPPYQPGPTHIPGLADARRWQAEQALAVIQASSARPGLTHRAVARRALRALRTPPPVTEARL